MRERGRAFFEGERVAATNFAAENDRKLRSIFATESDGFSSELLSRLSDESTAQSSLEAICDALDERGALSNAFRSALIAFLPNAFRLSADAKAAELALRAVESLGRRSYETRLEMLANGLDIVLVDFCIGERGGALCAAASAALRDMICNDAILFVRFGQTRYYPVFRRALLVALSDGGDVAAAFEGIERVLAQSDEIDFSVRSEDFLEIVCELIARGLSISAFDAALSLLVELSARLSIAETRFIAARPSLSLKLRAAITSSTLQSFVKEKAFRLIANLSANGAAEPFASDRQTLSAAFAALSASESPSLRATVWKAVASLAERCPTAVAVYCKAERALPAAIAAAARDPSPHARLRCLAALDALCDDAAVREQIDVGQIAAWQSDADERVFAAARALLERAFAALLV